MPYVNLEGFHTGYVNYSLVSPFHLVYSMYSYIFCINSYVYVSLFFVFALPCFLDRSLLY